MAGGRRAGCRTTAGAFRRSAVQDPERRDALEAELILDALEEEVLPLYYGRDESGVPGAWVRTQQARHDRRVIPRFNMRRVLFDYTQGLYLPAAAQYRKLAANAFAGARTLAEWKQRVRAGVAAA